MLYDSNLSRRELLRNLGLLASGFTAGSLLTSCRRGSKHEGSTLNFFGTGTLDIGSQWQQLTKDLGITVSFKDNQNDVGPVITEMITLGADEQYDIGGLQGGAEAELARARTILPWDLKRIPNFEGLWSWAKQIPWARWEGVQYGLPVVVNADSIIYLPDKVGTIDSYHAVFDPKLKGRTSMEDAWINSVVFTAIYLKESAQASIVNPSDLTVDELHVVMDFLMKHKKDGQFLKFWSGWEEGVNLITSGDVWVMTGWEPIVYAAQKNGTRALYARPKEGYEAWSNNLLLHAGARDHHVLDAAHEFANWELAGFYGCQLALQRGYVVPNDKTIEYARAHPEIFSAEQISHIETTIGNVKAKFSGMKGSVYWQNVRPTNYRLYEDLWSALRAS